MAARGVEWETAKPPRPVPIVQTPERFAEEAEQRLRGVNGAAKEAIEALQPYNRRQDPALTQLVGPHPLYAVHELNVVDKHRLILATVLDEDEFSLAGSWGEDARPTGIWFAPNGPPEHEQIVAVLGFVVTGENPQVGVNPRVSYEIAFERSGAGMGHAPGIILHQAHDFIAGPVVERLSRFLR